MFESLRKINPKTGNEVISQINIVCIAKQNKVVIVKLPNTLEKWLQFNIKKPQNEKNAQ